MTDSLLKESTTLGKLKKNTKKGLPPKIALLDIDDTLTGNPKAQQAVRNELDEQRYTVVFISSRPYELMLSDGSIKKSSSLVRFPSKAGKNESGKRYHIDLTELTQFRGLLDPDIVIGTTGIDILIRQKNGEYLKDKKYIDSIGMNAADWRKKVINLLGCIDSKSSHFRFRPIEKAKNYDEDLVDVSPPEYRIQIDFKRETDKKLLVNKLTKLIKEGLSIPLEFIDDSDPAKNRFSLYFFPFNGLHIKSAAADYVLDRIERELEIGKTDMQVFIAGDSIPELYMGLYSAKKSSVQFFIPTGARITNIFLEKNNYDFVGIDITKIKKNLLQKSEGVYIFNNRNIYIGDILFPRTSPAESVLSFLHSSHIKKI
jgi:hypothetical protein